MDHADALRMNATERYLLNELDTTQLEQFEEHMFECQECALDVHAAADFLEQSKNILAEPAPVPVPAPDRFRRPRPVHGSPGYARRLRRRPWRYSCWPLDSKAICCTTRGQGKRPRHPGLTTINVATRAAATPQVHSKAGQPFVLLLNIPSESRFSSYIADLYDPAGHIKWSLPISAEMANDTLPVRVPGLRDPGLYVVAIRGIPQDSNNPTEIGRQPFELSLQ